GYGISARNDPIADFVGDRRKTWGGVAGFGARLAPGVNVGFSVDQSRTDFDVPLALQSASTSPSSASIPRSTRGRGPGRSRWCTAVARSSLGTAPAGYNARLDGALSELSYYLDKDQSRLVPKAAF